MVTGYRVVIRGQGGGQVQASENVFVKGVELNGTPIERCYITHDELKVGGELRFVMSDQPNREWATSKGSQPYSMSR